MHQVDVGDEVTPRRERVPRTFSGAVAALLLSGGFALILLGKAAVGGRTVLIVAGLICVAGHLLVDRIGASSADSDAELIRYSALGLLIFGASLLYPAGPNIAAIPVGLAGVVALLHRQRSTRSWFRGTELGPAVAVGVAASVTLIVWYQRYGEGTHYGLDRSFLSVVGLVAFAGLNALAEEAIFRLPLLGVAAAHRVPVSVVSAVLFGAAHVRGVPSGAVGMVLACCFGLAQTVLVFRSRALWYAVISHVLVDVIVGVLVVFGPRL